ncbi:MAG: hypothetical protein J6X62_06505 [Bacteroidales bacterium]|nr:hypothetical protein [Bacteroidales bacterium]
MKRLMAIAAISVLFLASCNKIPNQSIYFELDSTALSKAVKADSTFAGFYAGVRDMVDYYGPNAEYEKITYRQLYSFVKSLDEDALTELTNKWGDEWAAMSQSTVHQADSIFAVWTAYASDHPEIDLQKELDKDSTVIPKEVIVCLLYKDDERLGTLLRDAFIISNIDSNYTPKNDYVDKKFIDYNFAKDSACSSFIFSGLM